jgi:hypothetical protein
VERVDHDRVVTGAAIGCGFAAAHHQSTVPELTASVRGDIPSKVGRMLQSTSLVIWQSQCIDCAG